ncbi:MAG: fumarylacetoacetate hydrolase family protein [Saprospiraceae bacterium]|nr:fumarylacetoacetate hydrolase family protein [Saprospiraceae bacterium]
MLLVLVFLSNLANSQSNPVKFVRYSSENQESFGILEGDVIRELQGDLFSDPVPTGKTVAVSAIKLLPPCKPSKVLAVGLNYRSHIGDRPIPDHMGLFAKYPTCVIAHNDPIMMPVDATDLHYEGELVVVIGKTASKVSVAQAQEYIFGVTAGNDVSERNWQKIDLQWLRAKGSDTFGPIGPAITTGLDYDNLMLQTRLNGDVVQSESSKDLIYSVDEIVSYISHYVTLLPGDVIFTGTPGSTQAMHPGDIVEIELEGVGILSNPVEMAKKN